MVVLGGGAVTHERDTPVNAFTKGALFVAGAALSARGVYRRVAVVFDHFAHVTVLF